MRAISDRFGVIEVNADLMPFYAQLDAYSWGKLHTQPLLPGTSARNMGKNDLWIAATALYFDVELHTNDKDLTTCGRWGCGWLGIKTAPPPACARYAQSSHRWLYGRRRPRSR